MPGEVAGGARCEHGQAGRHAPVPGHEPHGRWPTASAVMGQELLNPPTVEGWHTGKEWIDGGTLNDRVNFAVDHMADLGNPGVQEVVARLRTNGDTVPPEEFVDRVLELTGPIDAGAKTRDGLMEYAESGGELAFSTPDEAAESEARVGRMLQLVVASREVPVRRRNGGGPPVHRRSRAWRKTVTTAKTPVLVSRPAVGRQRLHEHADSVHERPLYHDSSRPKVGIPAGQGAADETTTFGWHPSSAATQGHVRRRATVADRAGDRLPELQPVALQGHGHLAHMRARSRSAPRAGLAVRYARDRPQRQGERPDRRSTSGKRPAPGRWRPRACPITSRWATSRTTG